jgi:hypothetical protein
MLPLCRQFASMECVLQDGAEALSRIDTGSSIIDPDSG